MDEERETGYIAGMRMVWRRLLGICLCELGYPPPDEGPSLEIRHAVMVSEREDVIHELRTLCAEYDCNDWDEHDHLGDVISKHLARHLGK